MRIAVLAHSAFALPAVADGAGMATLRSAKLLKQRGHEVVLVAARGTQWDGDLVEACEPDDGGRAGERRIALAAEELRVDVYYDNTHRHLFSRWHPDRPVLNQAHDREPLQSGVPNLVASSLDHQRDIGADYVLYNCVDTDEYSPGGTVGDYALWLGRVAPGKRPEVAVEVARRAGIPLIMRGPGTPDGPAVGEEKLRLLRGARCLLFPALYEAGPLTVLEAQACGTPVVCWKSGGTPEYVRHGVTGFVCESVDDMVKAVHAIDAISRDACRRHVLENHSPGVYVAQLESLLMEVANGTRRNG